MRARMIHRSAWKGNSAKLNFRFTEFSQQIALTVRRVSLMHECIFAGPQRKDRRVGEKGRPQGRDCPTLRGSSRDGQTLLQATRRAWNLRAKEGPRQGSEAG